jgi:serine protease Do
MILRLAPILLLFILASGEAAESPAPGSQSQPQPPPPAAADFRQIIQTAKDRVFPALVYIKCIIETHESGRKSSVEAAGSGVLISADGEVLTNWHVIDRARECRCLLYDGRSAYADIVGSDKDTDLAILKLKLKGPFPFAELGDSDRIKEGDFVMAMGAPWGMSRSVSYGVISCAQRILPEHSEYSLWLQTDASISPGNSGGPLLNTDGKVIGLNTLAFMFGGDTGFAVPSSTIRLMVDQIRKSGRATWRWTGLQLQPLRDFERNIYFDGDEGVVVSETDPDSPARTAGILPRDRILAVNDQSVTALTDEGLPAVRRLLGLLPEDAPAAIKLLRGKEAMTLKMTPRAKGRVEGEEVDCPRWDLTVKQINQFENPDIFFYRQAGVFIFGVKYPGNAVVAGLGEMDILLKIGDREVHSLDDVRKIHSEAIANVKDTYKLVFSVLRNGALRQQVLDFSREFDRE